MPQAYDRFLQKELAKLAKVTQPETPKAPKPEKNWWDIGLGALQVVGGAAEAVGGAALAVFTAPTVAGALAGSYMIVDGYYNMKAGINQMRNGFIGEKRYDTTHGLEEAFASLGAMTGHETLGRGTYYAVSILNPLSVSGKINSGVNISKAVTSTTKSLKAVDTATKEAPLLRLDLQTFAKNPSDDLVAKGTGKIPSSNTKVIELPEKTAPRPVKPQDATNKWEEFLGEGEYRNIHPIKGTSDPNRIFSADGKRSIRYGNHEMGSKPTKHHYHEEMWDYDPFEDTMTYSNTIIRVPIQR